TRRDVDWQRFDIRALKLDQVSVPDAPTVSERLSASPGNGVIFCDMATAIGKHADLVREYLGKNIAPDEPRKFNALHAALWNVGTFLYVPRDVKISAPLEI